VLLEAARSPAMRNQNGYLPIALARDLHTRLIRWALGENRHSVASEETSAAHPEPESDENFEGAVLLEDFLSQWQRAGVLSQEECDLLRKFKREGFEANELAGINKGKDRKSTRLNSSHVKISYAVFCLKKKKNDIQQADLTKTRTPARE